MIKIQNEKITWKDMFTQMATRTNLLECKGLLYLRRLRSFRWGDFLTNRQHEIDRQLPPH